MIRLMTALIIVLVTFVNSIFAQNVTGTWHGKLEIPTGNIGINFNIFKENNKLKATMDSPDQNAFGIQTDKTILIDDKIEIYLNSMMISYKGKFKNDTINGTFFQRGIEIPLKLTKKKIEKKLRPQDPKEPYSYISKEITFVNQKANNIKLAGTLTLPKNVKKPKVVILISGSGPQNRNEEIKQFNHRPFLVLSDFLTKNGIAVLRYDDRGVAQSEGTQKGATSLDFATDVEAAINYLKNKENISFSKIGLIGHSEGGFIASMLASKNKDIDFIVLLAAPGVSGDKILRTQTKKALELSGASKKHIEFNDKISKQIFNLIKTEKNSEKLKGKLKDYLIKVKNEAPESIIKNLTEKGINTQIEAITLPWITYFIKTEPKQFLEKVTCPILALNGSKDVQVLPKLNLEAIKNSTKHNKNVEIIELENLNHMFQTCSTGSINEYAQIEETFSPKAMKLIVNWINTK